MRRSLCACLLLFFFFLGSIDAAGAPIPLPEITADAAALLDARTGAILYARAPYTHRPPASTTKILTAIIALEKGRLTDIVTVSPYASWTEGSSIYLRPGERVTLEELIWGALLESGNDACVAIAEHLTGSEEAFARVQNSKARAIGAWDTHFVNPHGLPDPNHYTTAYDLATIARYALKNAKFQEIVRAREKELFGPEGSRSFISTNRLLWSYSGADGVKTGTTSEAGQCLVASATRDGRQLVGVVLHSDDRWSDAAALLDYGYAETRLLKPAGAGEIVILQLSNGLDGDLPARLAKDLFVVVPAQKADRLEKRVETAALRAPVERGQKVGKVSIVLDGETIASCDLIAARSVAARTFASWFVWRVYRPLLRELKRLRLL
ncbi:MAG: hypothetical protein PWQ41_1493 [Bacillota bacterium]|nr:hypothetical protein [Bacillota bacterium]MDK2925719.1 hypothetical protein [Bacillota bacterium]MDK2960010.1 hypothetical protein [Bacillota bacterium]